MPQASNELRAMFEDDGAAFKVLGPNFKSGKEEAGLIVRIDKTIIPTNEQFLAIDYLCDEWDYAWEGM